MLPIHIRNLSPVMIDVRVPIASRDDCCATLDALHRSSLLPGMFLLPVHVEIDGEDPEVGIGPRTDGYCGGPYVLRRSRW